MKRLYVEYTKLARKYHDYDVRYLARLIDHDISRIDETMIVINKWYWDEKDNVWVELYNKGDTPFTTVIHPYSDLIQIHGEYNEKEFVEKFFELAL